MKKNLNVIILVGLPASGKSTWAKEYIRKHPDTVRVGRDDFRYMLRNEGKCEPKIEGLITSLVEHTLMSCLASGLNVILDNTHLKASSINQIMKLVEYVADVKFQVFNIPARVCMERDRLRDKSVGDNVIIEMEKDWKVIMDSFVFQDTVCKPEWMRPCKEFVLDPEKEDAVLFDIDGTLANMHMREPYDWDKVDRDNENIFVTEHIGFHRSAGRKIILVSGRDEECREMTKNWLNFYDIHFDDLYMRPQGSWAKDTVVKKQIYKDMIEPRYNVWCVYDDRLSVLEMWHKLGIFTINVNQGNIIF